MSWQLFAAIHVGFFALGAAAAFLLRNRQLKRRLRDVEAERAEAAQTLAEAESRFATIAEEALENWLGSRVAALQEDAPATRLQRLVLQNERVPDPAFAGEAAELLAASGEAAGFSREKWQALRAGSHRPASTSFRDTRAARRSFTSSIRPSPLWTRSSTSRCLHYPRLRNPIPPTNRIWVRKPSI